MPTTYSTSLRLSLLETGSNSGTWGNIANTNMGSLIEQAIVGVDSVAMSDVGDTTLLTLNGDVDQARNAVLILTGSLSAQRSLIVPSVDKVYTVRNLTGQTVLVKTSAGTGVAISNGYTCAVYCDATNVFRSSPMLNHATNAVSATDLICTAITATTGTFQNMPTANGVAVVPAGVIWMWSGSIASIPSGWALCDGTNGTPDLRNRFIMGAGSTYAPGDTGGAASATTSSNGTHSHTGSTDGHTLTTAQIPAHQHTGVTNADGAHDHAVFSQSGASGFNFAGVEYFASGISSNITGARRTDINGLHQHSFTTNAEGGGQAHSHGISSDGAHTHTVATVPPYYALAFIMKL